MSGGRTPRSTPAAIFLDRDDTLIANHAIATRMPHPGYLYQPELVELLPGAAEACLRLSHAGFALVVVTNQSSLARGWCSIQHIDATNLRTRELLRRQGVELDGFYTSLHSPDGVVPAYACDHPWRKPRGGMLRAAALDLGLDLTRSWMIGDAQRDVDAGLDAGLPIERTIVVGAQPSLTRFGARVPDLPRAADFVLAHAPRPSAQ